MVPGVRGHTYDWFEGNHQGVDGQVRWMEAIVPKALDRPNPDMIFGDGAGAIQLIGRHMVENSNALRPIEVEGKADYAGVEAVLRNVQVIPFSMRVSPISVMNDFVGRIAVSATPEGVREAAKVFGLRVPEERGTSKIGTQEYRDETMSRMSRWYDDPAHISVKSATEGVSVSDFAADIQRGRNIVIAHEADSVSRYDLVRAVTDAAREYSAGREIDVLVGYGPRFEEITRSEEHTSEL